MLPDVFYVFYLPEPQGYPAPWVGDHGHCCRFVELCWYRTCLAWTLASWTSKPDPARMSVERKEQETDN